MYVDIKKLKQKFTNDFFDLMETSFKISSDNEDVSEIKLSTMTVVCDLACEIDLERLTRNFTSPPYPLCSIKKAKTNKDCTFTKRGKVKKSFYNQTTITYKTFTTKSIKVFSNGKLQITGVTSLTETLKTIDMISYILKNSNRSIINGEPDVHMMKNISIEMINSNFNYAKEIDLKTLRNIMKADGYDVTYDPDTYPCINAKINGISVFIFGTGNVVITGAKTLNGIQKTLETVTNIFNANKNINLRQGKGMKKEKKLVTYSNGYNENLYNACLV